MGPDPGAAPGRSGNTPSGTLQGNASLDKRLFRKFPKSHGQQCPPTLLRTRGACRRPAPSSREALQTLSGTRGAGPVCQCCFLAGFQGCSSTCSLACPVLFCSVLHRILVSGRWSPDTSAQHAFPAHLPGTSARQPCLSPEQKPAGQSLCKACQPDRLCRDKRSDGTQTGHSLSRGRLPGGLGLRAFCLAALPAPPCRGPCALSRRQSL